LRQNFRSAYKDCAQKYRYRSYIYCLFIDYHIFIVDIDALHHFYKTKNINLFLSINDQPFIDNKNYVSIIYRSKMEEKNLY